jgi:hypothetical protein
VCYCVIFLSVLIIEKVRLVLLLASINGLINRMHALSLVGEVEIPPHLVLRSFVSHWVAKDANLNILVTLLMYS